MENILENPAIKGDPDRPGSGDPALQLEVCMKLHRMEIDTVESLRKMMAQSDLEKFLRAQGLMELVGVMGQMGPEGIERVKQFLAVSGNSPEVEGVGERPQL